MKTTFFSKNEMGEEFRRDMNTVLEVKPDLVSRVAEFALAALLAQTPRETDKVYDKASDQLNIPRVQINRVLGVSQFLLRQLAPGGEAASDTEDSLVDDLKQIVAFPEDKIETVRSYIKGLKSLAKQDLRVAILQRAHEQSALPVLSEVFVEADLRAVFENSYHYEDDVSSYAPNFLGAIPLGIVRLELAGAAHDDVYFQLSKRSLQILIDSLVALQKELQVAERTLSPAQPKE